MTSGDANQVQVGAASARYTGTDRRTVSQAPGSTLGFLGIVAGFLGGVFLTAILVGREIIEVDRDSAVLTTGLAAGAVVLVLSSGLIAAARHVTSANSGDLDLSILMIMLGLGWLLPLHLVGVDGLAHSSWLGPIALGTALSVLTLTSVIALDSIRRFKSNAGGLAIVAGLPILITVASSNLLDLAITDEVLRSVGVVILAFAACVGLGVGLLRRHGLLAFVGLEMLGIEGSEILSMDGRAASEPWAIGAGMVAFAAAAIGLYGVVVDIRQSSLGQQVKLSESFNQLQSSQRLALEERQANQNRLHSLRSGLLAVETLVSLPSGGDRTLTDVLTMEVSRLKQLTQSAKLERTAFDIVPHLRSLIEIQHRQGRGATLEVPGPVYVLAAEEETIDAIHSLIHNAVRHAPGEPILVSADYVIGNESFVDVSVRDRGPGVPVRLQEKIFDRGMTTHGEGTGLGLALARTIAEDQGGRLTYRDRLGGGSVFTLRIAVANSLLQKQPEESTK